MVRTSSIYTIRADGTGKKILPGTGFSPSWTPDGKIIFVSKRSGTYQVWIMDKEGRDARQIGNFPGNNAIVKPQMARNGLIAFADQHGATPNSIWIMQKDGSGLIELVAGGAAAPSLALSGTWLTYTFETNQPYHREIYRINTDGTGKRQLTFTDDPDYPDGNASSISPDETMVAFFSGKELAQGSAGFTESMFTAGHRNIAVISAAGGARRHITSCKPITNEQEVAALSSSDCIAADNPSWSPDSKWIIYDRGAPSQAAGGTWLIDINGQNNERLLSASGSGGNVPLLIQS